MLGFEIRNDDLGRERFVNGTLVRDLREPHALFFRELTGESDITLDTMNVTLYVLHTLFAIL